MLKVDVNDPTYLCSLCARDAVPGSQTNCPTQSRPGLTSNPEIPGILTAFCFKLQLQLFQIQWVTLSFENGPVVQWSGATSFAILMAVRRNATTVGPN